MGELKANGFLEKMKMFVEEFFDFDPNFRTKREAKMKSLFQDDENDTESSFDAVSRRQSITEEVSSQITVDRGTQYFIRKVKVLQHLEETSKEFMLEQGPIHRSVEYLERISSMLREFLRRFDTLKNCKEDSEQVIYRYSYVVHRLI